MSMSRRITRRLTAGIGALTLAAGLAVTAAGVAQAAVPDQWGFAYVSKPTVPGITDLGHQAGSWPSFLHAKSAPGVPGQVIVTFPHIASKGGVVHVTAVNVNPVFCQAQKWGPAGLNEVVLVRCYKPGGAPVFSPFTVLYTTSSKGFFPAGRAYGYVHFQPGNGIVASFNSVGAPNSVMALGPGFWLVRMPGLGSTTPAGGVQVTAVNAAVPAKCEVSSWASTPGGQLFRVRCFNAGAASLTTGWSLSYQRGRAISGGQPKRFAYTFDNNPANPGPYSPAPPLNFNSLAGVNTITRAGAGLRLVQFPRVGLLPYTVLVSAFNAGPGFCGLLTIGAISGAAPNVLVRDVACYTATGAQQKLASLTTYTSAH